jgi:hypothetical protein
LIPAFVLESPLAIGGGSEIRLQLWLVLFPINTAENHRRVSLYISFPVLFAGLFGMVRLFRRNIKWKTDENFTDVACLSHILLSHTGSTNFLDLFPFILSFRLDMDFFIFYTFATIIMGTYCLESDMFKRNKLYWFFGIVGLAIFVHLLDVGTSAPDYPIELKDKHFIRFLLMAIPFGIMFWLWKSDRIRKELFLWSCVLLIAVHGTVLCWWYLYTFNMSMPKRSYYSRNQLIDFLTKDSQQELFRILPIKVNMYPNTEMVYRLYGINGYSPMYWTRYSDFMKITDKDRDPFLRPGFSQHIALSDPRVDLLALLNTKYLITQQEVYKVPNYYPRVWLSNEYEVVTEAKKMLEKLEKGEFSKEKVLLEEKPHLQYELGKSTENSVDFTNYTINQIQLKADIEEPCLLTLSKLISWMDS